MKDKKEQRRDVANSLILVVQFGLNFIIPILLCTILGVFLGRVFDTKIFTIIGILLGVVAAFNGAYRMVKGYLKNPESPGQRARRLEEEQKKASQTKMDKE